MADPIEVKKWFHEGPVDPITKLQYRMMTPQHRQLYNLFRLQQQLKAQLEEIESDINAMSGPILAEIKGNPESPMHRWAWWEVLEAPHPKWAQEFEAECGKAKADAVRAKYKKSRSEFLRVQFIHPRPPESK
jgi:hypothetical protein